MIGKESAGAEGEAAAFSYQEPHKKNYAPRITPRYMIFPTVICKTIQQ
jgi:hypothetical protein